VVGPERAALVLGPVYRDAGSEAAGVTPLEASDLSGVTADRSS